MSDIVRVSVNSTVKTIAVAVNQTTKVVMVDVQTSVASLVVQRRSIADGAPVDSVTTADYLGQQCIVGDANGPFTVYTASQVSPSRWTSSTTGNAATATALATARAINGVNFDGTSAITITAAALTLTGTTLNSGVVTSSLTSVGTLTSGTWNASIIAGQYGGTGVNNSGKTITLGGNLATSGSYNTTFMQQATTTVTLPSTSSTMARTDAAQTFTGLQTFASISANAGSGVSGAFLGSANIATFGDMASVGMAAQYSGTGVQIKFGYYNGDSRTDGTLYTSNLSTARFWTLPDKDGTLATTGDVSAATAVGTLTSGTWNATVIAGQYGGTGIANTGKTITLGGNLSTASAITFSCSGNVAFVGPTSGVTITLPSSSAWLARTDAAQTFTGVQTFSDQVILTGTSATDGPTYGAETLNAGTTNWSLGSGQWTGVNSTGFIHAAAAGTNALTNSVAAISGAKYQIVVTISSYTGVGTITVTYGGVAVGTFSGNAVNNFGPTTTNTNGLSITPTSDFAGTVVISIKAITAPSTAIEVYKLSGGTIVDEVRTGLLGNSFRGVGSGRYNTTGSNNTSNGYQSLYSNTTGSYNSANGAYSLYSNTTGNNNSANGYYSLYSNTTGSYNSALG